MALNEDLATYFLLMGYEWKIGEEMAIPNEDDIQKVIDHATGVLLNDKSDNVQLEVGRLVFKKRAGLVDVFVLAGTIGEKE